MQKTILIADDETRVMKIIVNYFRTYKQDYDILYASNGKVATEIALKKQPHLIILDWDMPIMNGLKALKLLKSNIKTQEIPVIIATGTMIEDIHLSEALEKGAADYIRKPINPLELVARVRSALRLSDAYQTIKQMYVKEKDLMGKIIDQKTRELSGNTLQLINKNELMLKIKNLLDKEKLSSNIRQVLKLIKSNTNLDSQWDRFKLHFEEVHPNFFHILKSNFLQLSDHDLRICAYIKMSLNNKEIMTLLNISPKGLETARYRLKKKLNLSRSENLNDFVSKV